MPSCERSMCVGEVRRGMWPSLPSHLHMSTLGRPGRNPKSRSMKAINETLLALLPKIM
jgi:hypothetical protein